MGSIALNLRVSGWMSSMGAPVEFGGNVEGQRLVRCVDRGAWMRRAGRGCDERCVDATSGAGVRGGRDLFSPPTLCGEKMMMPRGRAEGRWSGVPGWRDNAMR